MAANRSLNVVASKTLESIPIRIYVDVLQNKSYNYMSLAYCSNGPNISRIPMSMSAADEMKEKLTKVLHSDKIQIEDWDTMKGDDYNQVINRGRRIYYLDLKGLKRRRFIRLAHVLNGERTHMRIPFDLIEELRDTIEKYVTDHRSETDSELHDGEILYIGSKCLLFDIGFNKRGSFVRIQENKQDYRTMITIPESHFEKFRHIVNELADKLAVSSSSNGEHAGDSAVSSGEKAVDSVVSSGEKAVDSVVSNGEKAVDSVVNTDETVAAAVDVEATSAGVEALSVADDDLPSGAGDGEKVAAASD